MEILVDTNVLLDFVQERAEADYIVTRDMSHGHFKNSDVQVITPVDFINLIN